MSKEMNKKIEKFVTEESYICARCGYCNTVCPTYNFNKDRWESVSPRGKLTLVRKNLNEKYPSEFVNKLFQCTLCGHVKKYARRI